MLVLSRQKGDAIMIGEGIELTVLEIKGNAIKLGINAPADVDVYRSELYVKLRRTSLPYSDHECMDNSRNG